MGAERWVRVTALALALLCAAPAVQGHGERHRPGDELFDQGEKLMLGSFQGDQPGPLIVVPYVDGPLPCSRDELVTYRVPVSEDVSVTFVHNATHVEAGFAMEEEPRHFMAFGADTGEAVRALFLMQEYVVAIHQLAAAARKDGNETLRSGELGVPYAAGPSAHGISHPLEGGGLSIAYDDGPGGPSCDSADLARPSLAIAKRRLKEEGAPGQILHVVLLHDPTFDQVLPRPIDGSTTVLQANLYLARPGEDPQSVRAALETRTGPAQLAPLGALTLGLLAVAAAVWRARPG